MGIEPTSSAWKAEVIAIIRCPHPGTRLPDFSVKTRGWRRTVYALLHAFHAEQRRIFYTVLHVPKAFASAKVNNAATHFGVTLLLTLNWWWGKDYSSLRSSPFGPCCARCLALLDSNLVEGSHLPQSGQCSNPLWCNVIANVEFGGGGRIRTFEVCDGRFTVCSLWPLGNPTRFFYCLNLNGAGTKSRTRDLLITSQLLYQLSYAGIKCSAF